MRIGELSAKTGISASRIRFYEREGLLPPPARAANGYRDYPAAVIPTLSLIERAQRFGFSLKEIRRDLPSVTDGKVPSDIAIPAMEQKLKDLDAHIEATLKLRADLVALIAEEREKDCAKGAKPADGA